MINNPLSVHSNQASYSRWSWIIALLLALLLLWMLFTGRGPSSACCGAVAVAPVAAVVPDTVPAAVDEAFSFVATGTEFTSNGNNANVAWLTNKDALVAILATGEDLRAQGDNKNVVLSGIVDTDVIKEQKGLDAQAFFGSAIAVDNQLVVKAADTVIGLAPPPAAKLYFDTAKTALPIDANATLAPILEWLKANPSAKAVLSGFHDARGNQASNETLAKNRAKSVYAALITAGVDETRIEMRKPETVEGGADLAEARRVEVSVE